jgi:hypothetical protein
VTPAKDEGGSAARARITVQNGDAALLASRQGRSASTFGVPGIVWGLGGVLLVVLVVWTTTGGAPFRDAFRTTRHRG